MMIIYWKTPSVLSGRDYMTNSYAKSDVLLDLMKGGFRLIMMLCCVILEALGYCITYRAALITPPPPSVPLFCKRHSLTT